MSQGSLGIRSLLGLHYYVHDLERSRRFYGEGLGFAEIGKSSSELEDAGRQRSLVFQAGSIVITCSAPFSNADIRQAEQAFGRNAAPQGAGSPSRAKPIRDECRHTAEAHLDRRDRRRDHPRRCRPDSGRSTFQSTDSSYGHRHVPTVSERRS